MKKIVYGIITVIIIGSIFLVSTNTKTNKANFIRDSIQSGDVTIVATRNGSNGYILEEAEVEKLLDQFKGYEFRWKIDLRPRGGWSYRIDLEIEGKVYEIIFYGKDYLQIDGDEFFISKAID